MTNTDKCYALLEQEALRLWTDAKDKAPLEHICHQFEKVKIKVGDLQAEKFDKDEIVRRAGLGEVC